MRASEPFRWMRHPRSLWRRARAIARARLRGEPVPALLSPLPDASTSPARFEEWIAREPWRQRGFPDHWLRRADLPLEPGPQVAVVVHVFYSELLDELCQRLASLPVAFDLIVTNASGVELSIDARQLPQVRHVLVLEVENRGRDLWPLAQIANAGLLDPYRLVLKVHTKRSDWRDTHAQLDGTGGAWRDELLDALVGDEANVSSILAAFASSSELGMVTADGSILGADYWGDNEPVAYALLRRLELDVPHSDLVFAAGSMYWARAFVLQGLRAMNLSDADFEDEAGQVNATTAHALERVIGILAREAGLRIMGRSELTTGLDPALASTYGSGVKPSPRARVVPFYLPQFHPIPENDHWWGEGFTEWTNVTSAKPVYPGHHQPKLPGSLGFYDLRLQEVVDRQITLAQAMGVAGFMYYHYWFAGKQLLEGPIARRLRDATSLPFALMWANENWTRRWDGRENAVLIGQRYEEVPASRFLEDVMPILCDPRYLRIEGRAVIAVYRPGQIPDLTGTVRAWREAACRSGVGELLVLSVDVAREFHGVETDPGATGLDGSLGFPPHNSHWRWLDHGSLGIGAGFGGNTLDYRALVQHATERLASDLPDDHFPGVMVAFDNTARRQAAPDLWYGSNPYTFHRWLAAAVTSLSDRAPERRVIFVNAWNEWAESAILEPSDRMGQTYLLAHRDVVIG